MLKIMWGKRKCNVIDLPVERFVNVPNSETSSNGAAVAIVSTAAWLADDYLIEPHFYRAQSVQEKAVTAVGIEYSNNLVVVRVAQKVVDEEGGGGSSVLEKQSVVVFTAHIGRVIARSNNRMCIPRTYVFSHRYCATVVSLNANRAIALTFIAVTRI